MPHIANKLSLHTNSVEWNWQIFQGKRISGGVIFNVSSAFLICSAPDGWLLPLPYHPYWRTFLRASTCSATSWVLTQAGDEAEEARLLGTLLKFVIEDATSCFALFRTCSHVLVEGCGGTTALISLSRWTARARHVRLLPRYCKSLFLSNF